MMTPLLRFVLATAVAVLSVQRPVTAREQAATAGRTLPVNDIEMYYEERGAGEPLVLLHRFGGCSQLWLPLADRLAERFRLIVPTCAAMASLRIQPGHSHTVSLPRTFSRCSTNSG